MSDMKPNPRQTLAPTWLIVTHLLGAAVMLYFVSYPTSSPDAESRTNDRVINVAELESHVTASAPTTRTRKTHIKQEIASNLSIK